MAAKTSKTTSPDNHLIGRLTALFVAAVTLINKGRRSQPMIDALLHALQLFKENKLAFVRATPSDVADETGKGPDTGVDWQRHATTSSWAAKLVQACMQEPAACSADPAILAAAHWEFGNQPSHQCYWNSRFCIAVMCNMEWPLQRLAAWCAVSNGLNGYWEWYTHSSYDMTAVLRHIGVLPRDSRSPEQDHGYHELSPQIAASIICRFNLPTTVYSALKTLTPEQEEERGRFNEQYPYCAVL